MITTCRDPLIDGVMDGRVLVRVPTQGMLHMDRFPAASDFPKGRDDLPSQQYRRQA